MHSTEKLYWTLIEYKDWKIHIAATVKGLCFVGSQCGTIQELLLFKDKYFPRIEMIEDEIILEAYKKEIIEFLEGERTNFKSRLDFRGTAFQNSVWNALCSIGYGETKTYSDIASYLNKPKSIRAVGRAIGANPLLIIIPCHRVLGKDGSLTGYRGGLEMKKSLLKIETRN
ncbi:methylated-DNA--[protein]-cysteine S-methyltransferase [Gottfriedia acidiceleris]|uniref:Methylated-DNA--[protein]-cysteine S-methyltransferase n=1 Tax=Gottfriedia acidiceleris TaxID=371036 RepID=A0ABY4JQY8_9BACI|nr:methylated-DNA--[protein]-cysteine S-methyltransferase [Gottfriedia acidiceleris]UPM56248.1 methylated-DNA--[protein]-cysteine S-methyltransferase [Gottfriedia acidiceleris]